MIFVTMFRFANLISRGYLLLLTVLIPIILLVFSQIILGEILVFFDVIPLIQLFHLWFASLILGLVMVQYMAWNRSQLINE